MKFFYMENYYDNDIKNSLIEKIEDTKKTYIK